jgi:serine phosphatase RsbU (regulator of sigma subunit)
MMKLLVRFKMAGVQLKESDIVLFYNDGVMEAANSEGQQFGLRKVVDVLEKTSSLT